MHVKKILEYNYNYAEYIITDGLNDLTCMCLSVPLQNDEEPHIGMLVSMIYAFSFDGLNIKKVYDKENLISIKKGKLHFEYTLCGKVEDIDKSLVSIEGFTVSLEFEFPNGLPKDIYEVNDVVEFTVDRLDSEF